MFRYNSSQTGQCDYDSNAYATLSWRFQTEYKIRSSPVIAEDGTVYFGSYDNYLYALNPDGTLKWRFKSTGDIHSSPAICDDGTIVFSAIYAYLYALNPDGTLKWQKQLGWGYSSPIIAPDNTIYIGCSDGFIYAIGSDGKRRWRYRAGEEWSFQTNGTITTAPALDENGVLYVTSSDNYLYALDTNAIDEDDRLLWKFTHSYMQHPNTSPVIGPDNTVFIATNSSKLIAIDASNINLSDEERFKWYAVISNSPTTPAISSTGILFVGAGTNLYAFDVITEFTGSRLTPLWTFTTTGNITSAPIIDKNEHVYFGTSDSKLYAIKDYINQDYSIPRQAVKVWEFKAISSIYTSPAISEDGTIYFGSDDYYLYALHYRNKCIIKGITLDASTQRPVPSRISTNTGSNTSSGISGEFILPLLPGNHIIVISSHGRKSITRQIQLSSGIHTEIIELESGIQDSPWPMKSHDPRHTGRSPYEEKGWGALKWKYKTGGNVRSSPVIDSEGTIYVGSDDYYAYALNPDGTLKWKYNTRDAVYSSPIVGIDGTVYFASYNAYVYAFNQDGSLKWNVKGATNYHYSSPVIGNDGTLYICSYHKSCGYIDAIDPIGNKKFQKNVLGKYILSSPSIGWDNRLYVGSYNGYLYSINLDGEKYWNVSAGAQYSSPAIDENGIIYNGSNDNYFYAFYPDKTLKWKYSTGNNHLSSPAIGNDGILYIGSYDKKKFYAINSNGTTKWQYSTDNSILQSPAISKDGTIFFSSYDGFLYALRPIGDIKLKWRYQISNSGGENISSPAIGKDGSIYIGSSDGHLYAFNIDNKCAIMGVITELYTSDDQFGVVIPNVEISISGDHFQKTVQTDSKGYYYTEVPSSGIYDLEYQADGFITIPLNNQDVQNGKPLVINVEMSKERPLNIKTNSLPPGEVGSEYNQRIRISGGYFPYKFFHLTTEGPLPPGLVLDEQRGILSGIFNQSGTYSFVIQISDSQNQTGNTKFTIEVTEQLIFNTNQNLKRATRGQEYSNDISMYGGKRPYTFTKISGTIPAGLNLSEETGHISGVPTTSKSYNFAVRVKDDYGYSADQLFSLQVIEPIIISTQLLNGGVVDEPYVLTLSSIGGYGDYTWSIYSGKLVDGLNLDFKTGIISGVPKNEAYETIVFSVIDTDKRIHHKDFIMQVAYKLEIITTSLSKGLQGEQYSEVIRLKGGIGPYVFTKEGDLTDGLILDENTGIISGTPTQSAEKNVIIYVKDSKQPEPQTTSQQLKIITTDKLTIINSMVLPNIRKGKPIDSVLLIAGGGLSPYYWSLESGNLPVGIALKESKQLAGTAGNSGIFEFSLKVTDSKGEWVTKQFIWHVYDLLTIKTGGMPDAPVGIPYNFTLEAVGGKLPYQWIKTSGELPDGLQLNKTTGTIYGQPKTDSIISTITFEVRDSDIPAQTVSKTFTMETLGLELYIVSKYLPEGRVGNNYSARIKASQGKTPYSWHLSNGHLPEGLTFSTETLDAVIKGVPAQAGVCNFTLSVLDNGTPVSSVKKGFQISVFDDVKIQTTSLKTAQKGEQYTDSLKVFNGKPPFTWVILPGTGNLPEGLVLDSKTGVISGQTDMDIGESKSFIVRVYDSGIPESQDEKELMIVVKAPLIIETDHLKKGLQKALYVQKLEASGGIQPYQWSIVEQELPKGLELDKDSGDISGSPVECGDNFMFKVQVSESAESPNSFIREYQLQIVCSNDYEISGNIMRKSLISITLEGEMNKQTQTDENGYYCFSNLRNGSYVVTPSYDTYIFEPVSQSINVNNIDVHHVDFIIPSLATKGDVDGNGMLNIKDVIVSLQVLSKYTDIPLFFDAQYNDIDGDDKVYWAEILYIFNQISQ
jgi:outer membrane protein assembly factor BamB